MSLYINPIMQDHKMNEEIRNDIKSLIEINNDIIRSIITIINQNYSHCNNSLQLANEIIANEIYSFRKENRIKINNDIVIQRVFSFSIIGNIKQQNETENTINTLQLYPINNEIINSSKYFALNSNPKEINKCN